MIWNSSNGAQGRSLRSFSVLRVFPQPEFPGGTEDPNGAFFHSPRSIDYNSLYYLFRILIIIIIIIIPFISLYLIILPFNLYYSELSAPRSWIVIFHSGTCVFFFWTRPPGT